MSRISVFCTVILLVFGWTAIRPALAAPKEGDGERAAGREKLLQKFDANGNGQLDPEERQAAKEARRMRADKGGKGQGGPAPDPERRKKLMERFDKNGDGKLDESERAAAKEARAKRER